MYLTTKTQTMGDVSFSTGQFPRSLPCWVVPVTIIEGTGLRVGVLREVEGRTARGQTELSTVMDRCDVCKGESWTLQPKGKSFQFLKPKINACVFTPYVSVYYKNLLIRMRGIFVSS